MNEERLERDLERLIAAAIAAELILDRSQITAQVHPAPHQQPPNLPSGKVALYAWFYCEDRCLKCGKAGPNTKARYTSQHYNARSASSTLAQSLIDFGARIGVTGLSPETAGDWIKQNTTRVNLLFRANIMNPLALAYYEAFLHVRWRPIFEGREWTAW
jgi:hypothetical protein